MDQNWYTHSNTIGQRPINLYLHIHHERKYRKTFWEGILLDSPCRYLDFLLTTKCMKISDREKDGHCDALQLEASLCGQLFSVLIKGPVPVLKYINLSVPH